MLSVLLKFKLMTTCLRSGGSVVERSPCDLEIVGLIPDRVIPKDVIKIVPDASLLSAQHISIGLVFRSPKTSLK